MRRKKLLIYFIGLLLLMPVVFLEANVHAEEAPTEVSIVIHKRVFINSRAEFEPHVNTGMQLDETNDLANPQKTFGLNGVVFDIYDATDYITQLQTSYTNEVIEQAIFNADASALRAALSENNKLGEATTETVEGELGIARIDIKNLTTEPAILLILEQPVNTNSISIRSVAAPMLLSLPVRDIDESGAAITLATIHLYPKSTLSGRLPQTGGDTPVVPITPTTPTDPTSVTVTPTVPTLPKPSGRLPQTGEAKTLIGLLGMGMVTTASLLWFKRNPNKK